MGPKNLVKNNLGPKNCCLTKIRARKEYKLKKNLGLKNNFQKNFIWTIFVHKKSKRFWSNTILSPKQFWTWPDFQTASSYPIGIHQTVIRYYPKFISVGDKFQIMRSSLRKSDIGLLVWLYQTCWVFPCRKG